MRTFTPIWTKYRVAILKKMIDSSETAQEYRLYAHEFKAMNPKHKGGYAFVLQVSKGKPINNIKDSVVAQDLLEILQLSKKASELTDETPYQLTLDKQFVLHISRLQQTETK
jgi:hypothetical protein